MPGALGKGHILDDFPVTTDQQMTGYLQMRDFGKVRMRIRLQGIGKEPVNFRATVATRWQTDAVYDDERDLTAVGALIKVG